MLQWCDNFSNYGTGVAGINNALDGLPYAALYPNSSSSFPLDPDGVSDGRVMRITNAGVSGNLNDSRLALPTPNKTIGWGARYYAETLPSSNSVRPRLMGFATAANGRIYDLYVEPNGALSLYDDAVVLLGTTGVPAFTTHTWQHLELKVNTNTGAYELRREGVAILTGVDAGPPNVNIGILGWSGRQANTATTEIVLYMKDMVVWDDLGTYNHDFLGSVSVLTLAMVSDSSNAGWASTAATLYEALDEVVPDDADYISAAAAAAIAKLGIEDLPADITSVKAVQTMIRAVKTDGGDAKLKVGLQSVASIDYGTEHSISTTTTYWWDISEEDPNTVSPWTPGTMDDALLVINRTV